MTIRGPKRKNGTNCHTLMGDCLPFWMKNEKIYKVLARFGKNAYILY